MNVRRESSKIIDPLYEGIPPSTTDCIPLSVFDKVTYDDHYAKIYAYHPPNPPNFILETGLRQALSIYREFAGRLSKDDEGEPIILLNDAGVRFVEASADIKLDQLMPLRPSALCLSLHPSLEGVEELMLVQITRFTCGSMAVGLSTHHLVADGNAVNKFFISWSQACRGLKIHPLPLRDRGIFKPRDPPCIEYEHRGVEFKTQKLEKFQALHDHDQNVKGIVLDEFHFSLGFLANLKAKASSMNCNNVRPYSTFESLVAHLWIAITRARGLSGNEKTKLKIAVDGRTRMNPKIPDEYFGNLVLWAYPDAKVEDLLHKPLSYAAKLIRDAAAKVNDNYFRSFIDFASYKVKEENLVPVADLYEGEFPDLEVSSWLKFPFHDLDFGGGSPCGFVPSYYPTEGTISLMPSFTCDRSIDVFIALFEDHLANFKQICYEIDSHTSVCRKHMRVSPRTSL